MFIFILIWLIVWLCFGTPPVEINPALNDWAVWLVVSSVATVFFKD